MLHSNKQTKHAFMLRAQKLKEADVWFPLTMCKEWISLNSNLLFIWDFLSLSIGDFSEIVTSNSLWNGSGRQSWVKVFSEWGLDTIPKLENHNKIKWANFFGAGSKKAVKQFAIGESGVRVPSWFTLPTPQNQDGFKYQIAAEKKRGRVEGGLSEHFEAAVSPRRRVRGATESLTPATESQSPAPIAIVPAPMGLSNTLSVFNEAALAAFLEPKREELLSRKDTESLRKLFQALSKPVKQTGLRVLTSPAGFRGKGNTWVSIPHPTAKDSQASRSVLSRRSGSLAWLATQLGAAERATLKFVCDNKLDISSLPCAKVVLTPAQCIDIQATLRLSNSGVRTLAKVLKDCGVNAIFASAAKMKSLSDDWIIEACYYSGVMLDASKGGETISTLVYTANVFDMIARDLDILFSIRLFHQWEFDCFKGKIHF